MLPERLQPLRSNAEVEMRNCLPCELTLIVVTTISLRCWNVKFQRQTCKDHVHTRTM
jgi:hypothetical protein